MTKSFQKTANMPQELHLPHPGIINSAVFDKHFDLRCYKPSPDLQPFVVHIWTQHLRKPVVKPSETPIEIISGPNVYLFFTPNSAFVHDVTKHVFTYDPFAADVIAGVKFQPGGFYPFLQATASHNPTPTITDAFPQINDTFTKALLAQPDAKIVATIETLLRSNSPKNNKKMQLATKIADSLAIDNSLRTVNATARAFGMSERSLQLLFQTHVGVGVKRIITRRRMLKAIARTQHQPKINWVELAADLGYSSQSHFSRDFKNSIGLSPSHYLKLLRGIPVTGK